jgi:hypothetical protein
MEVNEATTSAGSAASQGEAVLTLYGIFGSDPGEEGLVTINGQVVKVKQWAHDKIVVQLPPSQQPNGAGDVVVTVRDHPSNAVPLTLWHGAFRYSVDDQVNAVCDISNEMNQTFAFDLYLRADVHPYREKPADTPIYPEQVHFGVAQDSSAAWTFGGSCHLKLGYTLCTMEQSGSGNWAAYTPQDTTGFEFNGSISPQSKSLQMEFEIESPDAPQFQGAALTMTCNDPQISPTTSEQSPWLAPILSKSTDFGQTPLALKMDEHLNISAGKIDFEPWGSVDAALFLFGHLEWGLIGAQFPPTPDTVAINLR